MPRSYRFFVQDPHSLELVKQAGESFSLSDATEEEIVFQLVKVLRVRPQDYVILLSGSASVEYAFEVVSASKREVLLKFLQTNTNTNELPFPLALCLCLPNKPEKLEFILQKATEIGVSHIMLFESEFSQMKHQLRQDRLEKIIKEAAEQSERARVPQLFVQGQFLKDFEKTHHIGQIWVAMERLKSLNVPSNKTESDISGNPFSSADFLQGITVVVGPEGGFSDKEKELFIAQDAHLFSLGKRVLRMETAAILSLGLAAFAGDRS